MGKPKDIPQDVWDAAVGWIHSDWDKPAEAIARAIIAAKAEERQAVVAWLDAAREGLNKLAEDYDDKFNKLQAERCIVRAATHAIAAQAIRQGEHVSTVRKSENQEA